MDVYVLLDVAWRDGADVVGVCRTLPDIKRLADDHARADGWSGWSEWEERVIDEGAAEWKRDRLRSDGSIHPSGMQEISLHQMPE